MVVRILILRAPGTNCDEETARAVMEAGAEASIVHTNALRDRRVDLFDYHGLILPGGFSYGDRVRAGVVWAAKLKSTIWEDLVEYALDRRPVLGICNGFQVLLELGLLPSTGSSKPRVVLAPNVSSRFEARWVHLVRVGSNRCVFLKYMAEGRVVRMPVAHSEGRIIAGPLDEELKRHVVLQYAKPNGEPARGEYPFNPNGSHHDVAGLCNEYGNVLGMMPHPERAVYSWQLPDYTSRRGESGGYADGWLIFKSMVDYVVEEIL